MPVSITVYDGAATIGGNKILLEDGGTALFLDFGTPFHTRALYYEEFLAPRSRTGLLDLIHMGLLPPLRGIYRSDLEDAGGRAWERAQRSPYYRECRADAVLLSHAHLDHCGYISFLDTAIPVVSTGMTAYLAKAIQDCGAHQFEGELCYTVPRVAGDEGAIGAGDPRAFPYQRRTYLIADGVRPDPEDFWNLSPAAPRGRYFPPQTLRTVDRIGGCAVRFLPVDHSIYGAAAIAVETSAGWVVYTGDLRRHGGRRELTDRFVTEAAALRPAALVSEGTNFGQEPGASEDQVREACLAAVREAAGQFVVADFGPRNVERLLTFLEIARRTGRRLAVTDRDAYLLTAMHAVDPSIPTPKSDRHLVVYRRALLKPAPWVERVREWYPEQVDAAVVGAAPGEFICCFSFFDVAELVDIDPRGGRWIYSASEPHDEEQQFELQRLRNWIDRFHLTPVGLAEGASPFHASGHISGRELRELIYEIAPARVIPVHTEVPRRFAETLLGDMEVFLPEIGVPITVG
ncbi:MAG: MBL fold metallo-hydrolase RNA specificity domain-containing protein [Armatimonadota bacterium]|nr:MBL fold metallo-hydrolase RNA specificity domain-containing protein [Armatimonadota bacterium]MDR7452110.1 MBL fold metallo-hydrolase RNA specificity domain-containing protein [Armatimonadota bacterium]MDR7467834.1 MBL fold metallo-hydrolase RNA specificity domain-containing protein [Armatimonadota bacterium]MDR7494722.1 MBL fold metallo-hydrolase RNA specificity domain-containing protein [Armatimonadota bacterium]MDR7499547.1 MBL fold metallo-hydrolase RNA specificity domain-containing pro